MLPYIPVEAPRVVAAPGGQRAVVVEPERVTLVTIPRCEPYGVIESTCDTQVGWLGAQLLMIKGTRARVIDPRTPAIVAEGHLPEVLLLRAFHHDGHALLANESTMMLVDATLGTRVLRARTPAQVAGACATGFLCVDGDSLREWDVKTAQPKRTWRAGGTVIAVGGTEREVWRITREQPTLVQVTALVSRGQPAQHALPEPIVRAVGHVRSDVVACVGESGRTYLVSLARADVQRLDAGTVEAPDDLALLVGLQAYVLLAQQHTPTQCASLAPPTWRHEVIAWTRSGVIASYPRVLPIVRLAAQLGLDEALVPAIMLCYGAHLVGSRGVPPEDIAEILGARWPEEASGRGLLAATGVLGFDGWITLSPTVARALDEL